MNPHHRPAFWIVPLALLGACAGPWKYQAGPLVEAIHQSGLAPVPDATRSRCSIFVANTRPGPGMLIRNGRVEGWTARPPAGVPVLDAKGAYVIPGLVDAHVHLSMAPGAAMRGDDAATTLALRRQHMRAYLAHGITTILDPAVDDVVASHILEDLEHGTPGPDYVHLGPVFSTPGGYMEDLFPPPVSSGADIPPRLDRLTASHAVGVKLTLEPGPFMPIWAIHPPDRLQAMATGARARGLRVFVHAMDEPTWWRALELKPDVLVHHPRGASPQLVAAAAQSGASVITTLLVWDVQRVPDDTGTLLSARLQATTPRAVMDTVRDPARLRQANQGLFGQLLPVVPQALIPALAGVSQSWPGRLALNLYAARALEQGMDALVKLDAAGMPLVMGSDAGNWPVFPNYLHGSSSWREIALLERAGFSPAKVLRFATVNAARVTGRPDVGCLNRGCAGDALLVAANPAHGLSQALETLQTVIKDGCARAPLDWMEN